MDTNIYSCNDQIQEKIRKTSPYYAGDVDWLAQVSCQYTFDFILLKVYTSPDMGAGFEFDTVSLYGSARVYTTCNVLTKRTMLRTHQLEYSDPSSFLE